MADNDIGQFLDYGQQAMALVQQMQDIFEQFDEDAIRNDVVGTEILDGNLWLLLHDPVGGKFELTTDEIFPPSGKYCVKVAFDPTDASGRPARVLVFEAMTGRLDKSAKRQAAAESEAQRVIAILIDDAKEIFDRCQDRRLIYNFVTGMRRALLPLEDVLRDVEDLRLLYLEWQLPLEARPIFHQLRLADPDMDPEDHANAARELSK